MAKLAVLFPGVGYHCDKPLLYYGRDVAFEAGFEKCIKVEYEHERFDIKDPEKMKAAALKLLEQAKEQLKDVSWNEYEEVVFIAKSIGTTLAANIADELKLDNLKLILLTPLAQTFQWPIRNAQAFIGTADQFNTSDSIKVLCDKNDVPLHVYEGGNHSLEVDDTFENIRILTDVMDKIKSFVEK